MHNLEYQRRWVEQNRAHVNAYNRMRHKMEIRFKGKRINVGKNPRTGICSKCKKKGLTHIHHEKYDPINPLKYTKELCPKCHTKLEIKKRNPKQYQKMWETRRRLAIEI